jgi:hypothetical protein
VYNPLDVEEGILEGYLMIRVRFSTGFVLSLIASLFEDGQMQPAGSRIGAEACRLSSRKPRECSKDGCTCHDCSPRRVRGVSSKLLPLRIFASLTSLYELYFSLSGIDTWKQIDQYFDYKKFYWNIVDLFAGGNNVHILERFNEYVLSFDLF